MDVRLFLAIGILAIVLMVSIVWLFYYIGFVKGFNKERKDVL